MGAAVNGDDRVWSAEHADDPNERQLLAYVEYFGWLRIVACLSNNYEGIAFSHCYAIDPVAGKGTAP